ncbi:AAA family ATPase [Legionella bononiensis]|uniref:AAA family ATPase n=1 Tax=Legionella bononiensis TaxID=2793102 RepID=A0ABS1WC30_9GAMM|nr:AAA family ATPase [Legionella bononiensis]MBL7481170.1 AAA family ATPase [Legionella bononiensis]MBL7526879.1 AAA family ATPase [Legionella bononiensis]MBL7564286.1 AAA family ATPase [Legionella bononiensis]
MLIIIGGLPGTGKTTISKRLASHLNAMYLRVDTVEQVLKGFIDKGQLIGPEGYLICYALAEENLRLGISVIADSVNPLGITRQEWQKVARAAKADFIEVEFVCSNQNEHKNRIESRKSDIPDQTLPSWQEVIDRHYEPWESRSLTLDTSIQTIDESVQIILDYMMSFRCVKE